MIKLSEVTPMTTQPSFYQNLQSDTLREIFQQPATLLATHNLVVSLTEEIRNFAQSWANLPGLRIIFTGAGSSAYIGEILVPLLMREFGIRVEAIATTDIVSAPLSYLERKPPTLLVSFGRSGDSPETLAAIAVANQCVDLIWHIGITCNEAGGLAQVTQSSTNGLALILPQETHDRAFAMTSSLSAMLLAALTMFACLRNKHIQIFSLIESVRQVLEQFPETIGQLNRKSFSRVVFLGSGPFCGLAREAALKLLELTDGQIAAFYDSPLGFRHGPKALVNGETLIVVFTSRDSLTQKYDLDLLSELIADDIASDCLALNHELVGLAGLGSAGQPLSDLEAVFPYLAFAQLLALGKSVQCGCTPDQPNAAGVVNRVVQGVRIHDLTETVS
jgi:tagatose-6-phosphate ketose/aldose isomerase